VAEAPHPVSRAIRDIAVCHECEVRAMSELAVIFPLEQMPVGDTYVLNDIPLHLTVLPNARLEGPVSLFSDEVRRVAAAWHPFSAGALGFETFGPDASIPVTEVRVVPDLRGMHDALCESVLCAGGEPVEPAYWGTGYRAHVTKTQRGLSLDPAGEVQLDRLALIDCTEPVRRVVWVGALGKIPPTSR